MGVPRGGEKRLGAAAAAKRGLIAAISLCPANCTAGITFSLPIIAAFKVPQ